MRISYFLLVAGSLFSGCGKKDNPPAPQSTQSSSGNPITAPVDYLGQLGKGQQRAQSTAALSSLKQAIRLFESEEGRLPKNLSELVGPSYLPKLPAPPAGLKFDYDPASGEVKTVPK